jgi:hypothetical protein
MGSKSLVVLIDHPHLSKWQHRLDIALHMISEVFISRGPNSSVFISCTNAPKFYQPDDNPLAEIQNLLSNRPRAMPKKIRVPCFNEQHGKVAVSCFVYEVILENHSTLHALSEILRNGPGMPSTSRMQIRTAKPLKPFDVQMANLEFALSHDWQGTLPFPVRFQALRIALDGRLSPDSVAKLLPELAGLISEGASAKACADALRHLLEEKGPPHPAHPAADYSTKALVDKIKISVRSFLQESSVYRIGKNHSHLALIHHVRITPSGQYLEGPMLEVRKPPPAPQTILNALLICYAN